MKATCKIGTLPDAMSLLVSLAEAGSGGAWPKNVSALWSHPQEMPVRPVGVYTGGKAVSCSWSRAAEGAEDELALNHGKAGRPPRSPVLQFRLGKRAMVFRGAHVLYRGQG